MAKSGESVVAIVQARMGSTRLPGKVLMNLGGVTVLGRVVNRLRRASLIDQVVVATANSAPNSAIMRECEDLSVECFAGSEDDVLDRYYQGSRAYSARNIVRITSDCPLIDSDLVDETICVFRQKCADYSSNVCPRTYPRGLDCEVFTAAALERAWKETRQAYEREHVTPYFYEHPELFRLAFIRGEQDHSQYRWTLDTSKDLKLLREIYARFGNRDDFSWREVIALMVREPKLADINAGVLQKSVHAD